MKKTKPRGRKPLPESQKKKRIVTYHTAEKIKCAGGEEKLREKIQTCNFCKL